MPSESTPSGTWQDHKFALGLFALLTALIALFLLRDASAFVNSDRDQVFGHVGASGGFTVAAAGTLLVWRGRRPAALEILAAGVLVTVALELAQAVAPSRGVELTDIAAGFSGVLLAALGIELLLATASLLSARRVLVASAACGSAALLTLLIWDLAPQTLTTATPDGSNCPLTELTGELARIPLGAELEASNGCLVTPVGGLGLLGPSGATTLTDDSVLVSSPLRELSASIVDNERIVIRAQILTPDFRDASQAPGFMFGLRSFGVGDLLQARTRDQRLESLAPNLASDQRAFVYTQSLEPNTRHIVEVELTRSELRVSVDGDVVGVTEVDSAWVDTLRSAEDRDLQLLIGNNVGRGLPFDGVIEWVEVET